MRKKDQKNAVVLITGAARRIGACMANAFHQHGFRVIVHYRQAKSEARALTATLNKARPESAACLYADLDDPQSYNELIQKAQAIWGRIDVLVNNASTFKPTPVGSADQATWDLIFNSNLKAPFFLSQAAAPFLKTTQGCIINITDIHAKTPMKNYPVYSCAKAGLSMLTKALACELAPEIRVNAIAPGSVLWPEGENIYSENKKENILSRTLLKKQINPGDIAAAALFLVSNTAITAETMTVDGGRQ